ncbi:hypothetical protein ruthe_02113 [Rubellimicrobium thermophilum DSM 16684]|uniref:Uncharacterized protein n=1 Tax=Rubellimicrobium thermophilum DSM 16684 TaxID=1123069 RepID=S9QY64_9RHOB|nr:hypothetical protein [Rubellimicrobium thermophilum]EPX84568.1 hypothetical protein ruthe_02113 [Rubellimicrobium thermophilum DSM 16684]
MTGPQLRALAAGHARAEAAAAARLMAAVRTAVWADAQVFAAAIENAVGGRDDDPADWLMGWEDAQ